jgi:hypothetical protein
MYLDSRLANKVLMAVAMAVILVGSNHLQAQEHVVPPADLHKELLNAQQSRQANLARVDKFFSSEVAKKALSSAKINEQKVEKAASFLSDEELARLAQRSEKIQNDFAAGSLTNEQITYIVIALATAVLILVIVAAR